MKHQDRIGLCGDDARFRLLTEPASLKRCPGRRAGSAAGRFRLLTEPASLKRPHVRVSRHFPAGGFRLLTEPASLKHPAPGRTMAECLEFPAPHRAGLIEARYHKVPLRSPGAFPAPHRAGLIEATTGPPEPPLFVGSFRLLTEPASLKPETTGHSMVTILDVSGSSQSRPH